ncbi:MAG: FAD-dependent oxidoreductase [Pseudomonadota bacterium]
MQSHARVVVIGGGNMGAGVLYHLAKEGWTDCLLIEKAELTSGATWHAAGLVSRMIGSYTLGAMHDYAIDLYTRIEQETDQSVSYHGCGSLRVATSAEHMDWINHVRDAIIARKQEAHIISAAEVAELNPLYDVGRAGALGAIYTPDDGHVDPAGTCNAMIKGARLLGAHVERQCLVNNVQQLANGEWQVSTEKGTVICEHVVNAGGYHARQIGQFSGLDLPITTLQHHYVITDTVPELATMSHEIPVTRDDYFCGYIRAEQNSVLIGLYDKQAPQPVWLDGCPWTSANELFEPNLDGISPWLTNCFERCPSLEHLGIKQIVNGGITYTPDGAMLLGPAPDLKNYWLACGATVGIAWGPGAGKSLAQWMVHGASEWSTRAFDPRRFGIWANAEFSKVRAIEDYTLRQAMPYPQHQRLAARSKKQSGVHAQTAALGALFEEAGGWERPRLYTATEPMSWRRTESVFQQVQTECQSVRENVAIGDFSAFAKFEIEGVGAEAFLNEVCANRAPSPGRTCLTLLLNERGTIEGEATIACTESGCFYLVTGAPSERRVWDWITLHSDVGMAECSIKNVTDEVGIITIAGPNAPAVLRQCTQNALDDKSFPWLRAQLIEVAGSECLALRMSFTGELAWELHCPMDSMSRVWDALWQAGQSHSIGVFGSAALDSLRLEKFYRGGHELTNDVSPHEVQQMRFVKLDKDFVGKKALMTREIRSHIALLAIENAQTECLGGEAVLYKGQVIGSVTSAGFGHTVKKSLVIAFIACSALAALENDTAEAAACQISLLGDLVPATLLSSAPYDPENTRLRHSYA